MTLKPNLAMGGTQFRYTYVNNVWHSAIKCRFACILDSIAMGRKSPSGFIFLVILRTVIAIVYAQFNLCSINDFAVTNIVTRDNYTRALLVNKRDGNSEATICLRMREYRAYVFQYR